MRDQLKTTSPAKGFLSVILKKLIKFWIAKNYIFTILQTLNSAYRETYWNVILWDSFLVWFKIQFWKWSFCHTLLVRHSPWILKNKIRTLLVILILFSSFFIFYLKASPTEVPAIMCLAQKWVNCVPLNKRSVNPRKNNLNNHFISLDFI